MNKDDFFYKRFHWTIDCLYNLWLLIIYLLPVSLQIGQNAQNDSFYFQTLKGGGVKMGVEAVETLGLPRSFRPSPPLPLFLRPVCDSWATTIAYISNG